MNTAIRSTFAAFAALPALAFAHSPFLLPSATVLSKPAWITVDGAATEDIFDYSAPLRLNDLVVTAPDGSALAPENDLTGRLRRVFDLKLQQPGTYRIRGENGGILARYKDAQGKNTVWRGTAADFAARVPKDAADLKLGESVGRVEAYVTLGKPNAVRPTGQGLELVAVTHPNDLYAGEEARFRFTYDGKPVAAGTKVEVVAGGRRFRDANETIELATDANGEVRVKWPGPGLYRLEISTTDGKTSLPQIRERRLSYAATLEVLPQ